MRKSTYKAQIVLMIASIWETGIIVTDNSTPSQTIPW